MSWKKLKSALSDAFAYGDGRDGISEEDIALLDRAADFVVRRRLVAPAMLLLESTAPFNFIGSSAMAFFRPMVGLVFKTKEYERLERLLEKRCSISLLAERIELRDHQRKQGGKDGDPPPDPPPGPPT